jgi:indolepyruvate ferredoxin oxidoreductase alpha subunit
MTDFSALPPRPPILCPGCPHRATYATVRKVIGDDVYYASDIGCYALGFFPPLRMADLTISMGSGIATGSGLAIATGKKVISYIGDSTFFHSGIAALSNAVFNNHNITVIILDNGITAMTGLQPSPAGDLAKMGIDNTHLSIEDVVTALGVKHMAIVNPRKMKALEKAVEESVNYEGLSVIISRDLCVLHANRVRSAKKSMSFSVDQEKCKKHRDCIKQVACPALFIEDDKVQINNSTCTGCSICAQVCPENAIVPKKQMEETV